MQCERSGRSTCAALSILCNVEADALGACEVARFGVRFGETVARGPTERALLPKPPRRPSTTAEAACAGDGEDSGRAIWSGESQRESNRDTRSSKTAADCACTRVHQVVSDCKHLHLLGS
jgi:hypothetical protein